MEKIKLSIIPNDWTKEPEEIEFEWNNLCDILEEMSNEKNTLENKNNNRVAGYLVPQFNGISKEEKNITGMNNFFAMDVDNNIPGKEQTFDSLCNTLDVLKCNYVIYTTTKAKPTEQRVRILIPLTEPIPLEDWRGFWSIMFQILGEGADEPTRNPNRIFYFPADWDVATYKNFKSVRNRGFLNPHDIFSLGLTPYEKHTNNITIPEYQPPTDLERIRTKLTAQEHNIDTSNIYNCILVTDKIRQGYNKPKGGRFYTFMCDVALNAISNYEYQITPNELLNLARQMDQSIGETDPRKNGLKEAQKAISWAKTQAAALTTLEEEFFEKQEPEYTLPECEIDLTLLPIEIQDTLQALNELHNAPPILPLSVILGLLGAITQQHYKVDCSKFDRPATVATVTLSPSGTSKSSIYKEVMRELHDYIDSNSADYKMNLEQYEYDLLIWENEKKKAAKTGDSNFIINNPKPQPPASPNFITSVATANGIRTKMQNTAFGFLSNPDAGQFMDSWATKPENATETYAVLTNLFEGENPSKDTGTDSYDLPDRALSVCLSVQTDIGAKWLGNKQAITQGFMNRILFAQIPHFNFPPITERTEENIQQEEAVRNRMEPFHTRIRTMLQQPPRYKTNRFNIPDELRLDCPKMTWDNDVFDIITEFTNPYTTGTIKMKKGMEGFSSRLLEMTAKIATCLSHFEGSNTVTERSAMAAINIMKFYLNERILFEAPITVNKDSELINDVCDSIMSSNSKIFNGVFDHRALLQYIKSWQQLSVEDRRRILKKLVQDQLIKVVNHGTKKNNLDIINWQFKRN